MTLCERDPGGGVLSLMSKIKLNKMKVEILAWERSEQNGSADVY